MQSNLEPVLAIAEIGRPPSPSGREQAILHFTFTLLICPDTISTCYSLLAALLSHQVFAVINRNGRDASCYTTSISHAPQSFFNGRFSRHVADYEDCTPSYHQYRASLMISIRQESLMHLILSSPITPAMPLPPLPLSLSEIITHHSTPLSFR